MQPLTLISLADLATLNVDTIIDVRATSEFAEDHLPGAINLPVLDDGQRAEVGTIYKQVSPFNARKIGGALVAQNTARHLQGPLADKKGDWQPLVYCWRGGQRSGAFATILSQVGWRVQLLQGGYRSYRRLVVGMLYDDPLPFRMIVIEGGTGTAKTELLEHLKDAGAQTLDLEGLAHHRGSLFGAMEQPQPAQKLFESRIAGVLSGFDPTRPIWVEAESSRVGDRTVPPMVWSAMQSAPRAEITAPKTTRAAYLARAYSDLTEDATLLKKRIGQLAPYHAAEVISDWQQLARGGNWATLAEGLISAHYDPRYAKSASRSEDAERRYDLAELNPENLSSLARQMIRDFS